MPLLYDCVCCLQMTRMVASYHGGLLCNAVPLPVLRRPGEGVSVITLETELI
jgi:hypothetical protein